MSLDKTLKAIGLRKKTPADKVRELLIWQLVSGYKLREMEQMESLKDNYWGKDGDSEFDK